MRKNRILALLVLILCMISSVQAQEIPQNYKGKTRVTMGAFGTVSSLCIFDDFEREDALAKYDRVWEQIKELLEEIDLLLSTSIETSEIARFNALPAGATMEISPMTAEVFMMACDIHEKTNGYFDPSVFPLVDLWGFSPRFTFSKDMIMPYDREWKDGTRALPEQKYIEGFLELVNMDGIVLSGDEQTGYILHKNTPSVMIDGITYPAQIDLGGIAKGYVADLVAMILEDEGYEYGYFSCGSSSIRLLKNASGTAKKANDPAFSLQVRIPRETQENAQAYAHVRVMDQALSSSGDYDNNYVAGGNLCSHIISPFTGYPLNYTQDGVQGGISTVTLLSGSAIEDDALTTALCLMGVQDAIDYVNQNLVGHNITMVLYRADESFYEVVTNIPEGELDILDAAYCRASFVDEYGNIVYNGKLFTD